MANTSPPAPGAALPTPKATLVTLTGEHFRRCTFRRLSIVTAVGRRRSPEPGYAVDCLYGGAETPLALGDLRAACVTCEACTNSGIFRADED